MKTWISGLLAVVILVCVGAMTGSARQQARWEYYLHTTDSVGTLNKWGQDGWEVVAAYTMANNNDVRVLMKRRTN